MGGRLVLLVSTFFLVSDAVGGRAHCWTTKAPASSCGWRKSTSRSMQRLHGLLSDP